MTPFLVTYVPVPRLWCEACEKVTDLPSLAPDVVEQVKAQHRCGERTSPWTSPGVR